MKGGGGFNGVMRSLRHRGHKFGDLLHKAGLGIDVEHPNVCGGGRVGEIRELCVSQRLEDIAINRKAE